MSLYKRALAVMALLALIAVPTAATPAPTLARGACIKDVTATGQYTYADRYANIQFGDPVRYSVFKMTAHFCYDGLGNAWGTAPITWARVSGSAFINIDHQPYYTGITGGAYAAISYGYFAVASSLGMYMRIGPRISISGINGHLHAYDSGAVLVTEGFIPDHDYDPVFVSATP